MTESFAIWGARANPMPGCSKGSSTKRSLVLQLSRAPSSPRRRFTAGSPLTHTHTHLLTRCLSLSIYLQYINPTGKSKRPLGSLSGAGRSGVMAGGVPRDPPGTWTTQAPHGTFVPPQKPLPGPEKLNAPNHLSVCAMHMKPEIGYIACAREQ